MTAGARWRRFRRRALTALGILAAPLVVYGLFLAVGCWPVNRDFTPTPNGVAVYVWSDAVHTDLVLPIQAGSRDWRSAFPANDFRGETAWATHYAIGWGDRGFYLETPTWDDLKASTAFRALAMPSGTVVHVQAMSSPEGDDRFQPIALSAEQYKGLCESIEASLATDADNQPTPIAGAHYHRRDAFYEGRGSYSCFYTCNSWAGDQLKAAGVCAPLWTPLPGSATWYVDRVD